MKGDDDDQRSVTFVTMIAARIDGETVVRVKTAYNDDIVPQLRRFLIVMTVERNVVNTVRIYERVRLSQQR